MSEFRPTRIRRLEQLTSMRAANRAFALAAEGPMPCPHSMPDATRAAIDEIDRAVAAGDIAWAFAAERRLPASIDAEPAIVDRIATLRLLEGDAVTALAVLGAVARPSPRLDLLRVVALVALDDHDSLDLHLEELCDEPSDRPLAAVVAAALAAQARPLYPDVAAAAPRHADPSPSFCGIMTATVAARRSANVPCTAASLCEAALRELSLLLAPFAGLGTAGTRSSGLARRLMSALTGLARDLGLTHAIARQADLPDAESVAVRVSDRRHLQCRVVRPSSPSPFVLSADTSPATVRAAESPDASPNASPYLGPDTGANETRVNETGSSSALAA
jgi:hypothetical protein